MDEPSTTFRTKLKLNILLTVNDSHDTTMASSSTLAASTTTPLAPVVTLYCASKCPTHRTLSTSLTDERIKQSAPSRQSIVNSHPGHQSNSDRSIPYFVWQAIDINHQLDVNNGSRKPIPTCSPATTPTVCPLLPSPCQSQVRELINSLIKKPLWAKN